MTDLIIKLFVKNHKDTQNQKVRESYGKVSGIVGIVCNLILFCVKLISGLVTGSVSITADAVNNLSDASSSVISLLGFKLAGKPADEEHPYGHGRYEYLSGLIVSVIILVIGVEILKSAVRKIIHPENMTFSITACVILLVSVLVKLWMMIFNRKIGKRIESGTLLATAQDSRNDVISTAAVLLSTFISRFTSFNPDGYVGLLVALFILYSGYELIKDTLDPLLGKAPEKEFVKSIHNKIMTYPEVLGVHDLLVHDYGPGRQFASVHVEMPAEGDVIAHHDVLDNIEKDFLKETGLRLVAHYDPVVTTDEFTMNMRTWLAENIRSVDERLQIHDLRVVHGTTHTNLIFDCLAPYDDQLDDKTLKQSITALIREAHPDCEAIISIDRDFSSMT